MAPKVKAKAKARARAMAVAPRGRVRRGLRRPAGIRRPAGAEEEERSWATGAVEELHKVKLEEWTPGMSLVVTKASYYGAEVQVAGRVKALERTMEGLHLVMMLTGTTSEEVLRVATANPTTPFRLHVCPVGCAGVECGAHQLHGREGRKAAEPKDEDWTTSLELAGRLEAPMPEEDQLAKLRERALQAGEAEVARRETPREERKPEGIEESEDSKERGKKRKKKDKKEKRKEKNIEDGRFPKKASQKKSQALFGGTALDASEKVQKRVVKKAQRFMTRKKKGGKSSSSDSQEDGSSVSSSSGPGIELEGLFTEENKPRALADRYPGVLTLDTISTMRRSLLTTAGEEAGEGGIKPIALLYYRNQLTRKASGAQSRELLNLCSALDQLLRGRAAQAADIISQRIKAQEAILHGTSWTIAQRMEVTAQDTALLVGRSELTGVQKEEYQESLAKWRSKGGGKSSEPKGKNKGGKNPQGWGKEGRKEDDKKDKGKGSERK